MSRLRHFRIWTIAAVLAVSSLRCGENVDPEPATNMEMADGNSQNGVVGQPLSSPLVVLVTDASGNPVSGFEVHWAAQGGGSVSPEVVETGSNGRASAQRVLATELGQQTTTATGTGLEGSPVTFISTAVPAGAPGSIAITTNPPVEALDAEVFDPAAQPVVQVKDAAGNPASGVQVTVTASGGTLEGSTTATTDGSGIAAFQDLGIRGTGSHTLVFTAGTVTVSSSPVQVSPLSAQAAKGSWGPIVPWDIVPLHMNLLPSGKIFAWGKRDVADTMGMPRVWDPASGSQPSGLPVIHVNDMLFCAGHTLMPDGSLMISGGHLQDDRGIPTTYFFSDQGAFQRKGPDMHHGRWYPTLTVLPDGRMLTMAGRDQANQVVTTPEIWEDNGWVELPGAGAVEIPYYPRNFVDPKNGLVFYASERVQSRWFNVDGTGVGGARGGWTLGPTHLFGFNRDYGSAVMYAEGKILVVGGGGHTGWPTPDRKTDAPTATAEIIDLKQSSPAWQTTGSMANPRRHMNATILPDGQVLATGGTRGGGFVNIDPSLAVKQAELWNPSTGQWTTMASNSVMRVYHSVSMLLPDGTVLHGASGDADAFQNGVLTPVPPERNHEIFSPPYLFKGARPNITSAPATVGYDQVFSVATPNAAQITEVRWIHLGTVTHAFDSGQRANTLNFTRTATGLDVTAPVNPNLAPPGYYQLFILNRNGVPSKGQIIRIQ